MSPGQGGIGRLHEREVEGLSQYWPECRILFGERAISIRSTAPRWLHTMHECGPWLL